MKVAAVVSDLMLFSRIDSAVRVAGVELTRVDSPDEIPPGMNLVLVDWSVREPGWAAPLQALSDARVILFGPHVDLDAHAAARVAHLGPMWARSRLLRVLPSVLSEPVERLRYDAPRPFGRRPVVAPDRPDR